MLAGLIDSWKNRGLTPEQVPAGEAASFAGGKGKKLYAAYQERLKVLNAADFGDLLLECIRLFREQPEVLRQYQARFRYILVDEYQDTNVAQYLWLRLLGQSTSVPAHSAVIPGAAPKAASPECRNARTASMDSGLAGLRPRPGMTPRVRRSGSKRQPRTLKNICCVGDDDQSIYGWRGAEVDNILRFEHDFPGAKIIRLERNYRSHRPHPRRRLAPDRPQRGPARQDAAHRGRAGREGAGHLLLGLRGRGARDRRGDRGSCSATTATAGRTRSTRSPSWCAPRSRCASSRTASSRSACPIA